MTSRSLEEAIVWLTTIDGQIRRYHPPTSIREPGFSEPLRKLTSDEWKTIAGLVTQHELPCQLYRTAYGFSLVVYRPGEIRGVLPDPLLEMSSNQFPFPSARRGFAGQEETLRLLGPITHSIRNQQLLEWSGFPRLDEASSYSY